MWDMINWIKSRRIILMTTHNMEEADALGDEICMFHNGRVAAIGDSLYLKRAYGAGYQIRILSHPSEEANEV